MKVRMIASVAIVAAGIAGQAAADIVMPAWQAPGYVMDEVVVTAQPILMAWQEPGFVMDEIVVTAPSQFVAGEREDVNADVLERMLALHEAQREMLREARRQLHERASTPTS